MKMSHESQPEFDVLDPDGHASQEAWFTGNRLYKLTKWLHPFRCGKKKKALAQDTDREGGKRWLIWGIFLR